jgi:NAD(P)-dependent dehydrogenase (short-subunit alcohol dehydrogenase family)
MDLELTGKTVVVTGASEGIGREVAGRFHDEGCIVHLVSRSSDKLSAAVARIGGGGSDRLHCHPMDLSDSNNIPTLLAAVPAPDILVNNAGAIPGGDIQAVDESRWREAWDLKVFGYINLTRAYLSGMQDRQRGVIVNVTGLAADRTDAGYVAGTTGNAGLNAFTRAVGSKTLNHGVRVLAVSPGAVETDRLVGLMQGRAQAELGDKDRWREYLIGLPAQRAASAVEVADVVVFMASARASYMSGSVITVDGGHGANMGSFT